MAKECLHNGPFPELWGGIECTLNRVGNRFQSQLALSGHLERPDDLDLIAQLGIRSLRYPVLWEMVAPQGLSSPDWSWADQQLARLQALEIEPIVGLIHHGSGPLYTSLIDPAFSDKLARYALLVARRYPWMKFFTPVNEPLTTARFSALYGHWYPHLRDDRAFVQALLQQCRGIVLAMQAIRQVIPHARLVMTEDLGCTFATPLLQYQADFENQRRWLSFDILFGRVDADHPLWLWLCQNGATPEQISFFTEHPTPPDIIGINYYVTSDRYLDDRLQLYPSVLHGGNGRQHYVDVEAVRVRPEGIAGHEEILRSAWLRYGQRMALTEVHLGSSREEQLRWFYEAWRAVLQLRREGADICAVTAWALLGSFDWNTLCTQGEGLYEPGAFDVRGDAPRPTAIAKALTGLGRQGELRDPSVEVPGWWRRPERFRGLLRPADCQLPVFEEADGCGGVLIVGRTGTLGQAFSRLCQLRGLTYHLLSRSELDICSPESVAGALRRFRPRSVINCAGFVRIDEAEAQSASCFRENTTGPALLATECARHGVPFLTFSSDMVFDGDKGAAYTERDQVAPLNIYGKSKAEAERRVLELNPGALVIRTAAFFGPWDDHNFVTVTLRRLSRGEKVEVAEDLFISPTYLPDLVNACLDLIIDGERGLWHLANTGSVSWAELAHYCAGIAGLDATGIVSRPSASFGYLAKRPAFLELSSVHGVMLPSLEDAVQRFMRDFPEL